MVRNRCNANFADAVGLVSDGRDIFAGSVTARGVVAAQEYAAVAKHNSAAETIPGDTGWHVAPDSRASRAADYLSGRRKRARGRTIGAALRLAVHAGVAVNPGTVRSVAAAG